MPSIPKPVIRRYLPTTIQETTRANFSRKKRVCASRSSNIETNINQPITFCELGTRDERVFCKAFLPGILAENAFAVLADYENFEKINSSVTRGLIISRDDDTVLAQYLGSMGGYEYQLRVINQEFPATSDEPTWSINWKLADSAGFIEVNEGMVRLEDTCLEGVAGCQLELESATKISLSIVNKLAPPFLIKMVKSQVEKVFFEAKNR